MSNGRTSSSTSPRPTTSTKSTRTSTKSTTTLIKTIRTSPKSTRTSSKSAITSTKSSTTSVGLSEPQVLNSTTTWQQSNSNLILTSQENDLFCHPHCIGALVGIALGSLLGVVLVILALIAASRIYNRRRQSSSDAASANTNTDVSQSTPGSYTSGIENNYESNQTGDHASVITNTNTLMPSQTTRLNPPIASGSNNAGSSRISEHIYAVMSPIVKKNPTPPQAVPSTIYLEPLSDQSDALPPAKNEHGYYNVGQNGVPLMYVDNIEYEISDCRLQPSSSSPSNSHSPCKEGSCTPPKTLAMASTSSALNKTVIANYDNVGIASHG